jgi:16S rRNA (cytosine1402-N4)-methyltransferase
MVDEQVDMSYHMPVLVDQVVEGLVVDRAGVYLDATAGGGGHSTALLAALGSDALLVAVDRDDEAVRAAGEKLAGDRRVIVRKGRFAELDSVLDTAGVASLNGALFDLGVSSHQIDAAERGFSYRAEGPLDMRMDPMSGATAADIIESVPEAELVRIMRDYGEERQARSIARSIVRCRQEQPLRTTEDLRRIVIATRPKMVNKTLARVFQAFRIAINGELEELVAGLATAIDRLAVGGRLAVIAYHSLEDRIVKQHLAELMRGCICPPRLPACCCDHQPEFAKVGRGRIKPAPSEVDINRRARSAVLRLYEKLEGNK